MRKRPYRRGPPTTHTHTYPKQHPSLPHPSQIKRFTTVANTIFSPMPQIGQGFTTDGSPPPPGPYSSHTCPVAQKAPPNPGPVN